MPKPSKPRISGMIVSALRGSPTAHVLLHEPHEGHTYAWLNGKTKGIAKLPRFYGTIAVGRHVVIREAEVQCGELRALSVGLDPDPPRRRSRRVVEECDP